MTKGIRKLLLVGFLQCLLAPSVFAIQAVNINKAPASEIADALQNIGMAKAEAIVKYRTEHGPFTSVGQLVNVKGIGEKILEKNKGYILLKDPQRTPDSPVAVKGRSAAETMAAQPAQPAAE